MYFLIFLVMASVAIVGFLIFESIKWYRHKQIVRGRLMSLRVPKVLKWEQLK